MTTKQQEQNMSGHTPGPWSVTVIGHDLEIRGNGYGIAHVLAGDALRDPALALPGDEEEAEAELKANACLIAAAPEMLAALEEITENAPVAMSRECENLIARHPEIAAWHSHLASCLIRARDKARAAIAAAKGGAKICG